jgi:DNA mismatch repair protein MSH6
MDMMYLFRVGRLDAVGDLMEHADFGAHFDKMAKGLPDLERLLSRVHAKSIRTKDL